MFKISAIIKNGRCTGCGACRNTCNKNAISMVLNNDGFYQPSIDTSKCVNCGLCDSVCPVVNPNYSNNTSPLCYALMASDSIRAVSSSGGAFQLLCEYILKKNGVICGVAYTKNFMRTEHIFIDSAQKLNKLRGSKYIMSDTGETYKTIKEYLLQQKYVLFSGTPCQVAGLNNYLKKLSSSPYLLTVDLICHGIPSVKAFETYIRDLHGKKSITHLGFKDKEYGWHASMTIGFEGENSVYNMPCETDPYFKSYLNGVNKNKACGDCPFAKLPRQGDVTIGDYWGINKYDPKLNDTKGTSVVLINNDKAKELIPFLKKEARVFVETPLQAAIQGNSNLVQSPKNHISRNQFFKNLGGLRYQNLVNWALSAERYDIGLVGIPTFPNFGGALTYYGLYRALRDMGYSVALFSRPRSTGKPPIPPEKIYTKNPYDPSALKLDYLNKTAMSSANDICENFIVGSDQLFNSDLYKSFGEIVTLDWISDNHRKIAYAASFGHNYFWGPEKERAKMAHFMQKFDAFSVREEEAVNLAKETFGVDATWVMDPVFLCDKKHYKDLANASGISKNKPHIFGYILDPTGEKNKILDYCSKKLKLPVELYSEIIFNPTAESIANAEKQFKLKLLQGNINERLYSLINSDFIVADSFHGICFAIIFNKPFIAILNSLRGASRFYTILGKLNLLNRMVTNLDDLTNHAELLSTNIDFTESQEILANEKNRCLTWLQESISPNNACKKPFSTLDIVEEKLQQLNKEFKYRDIRINAVTSGKNLTQTTNFNNYLDSICQIQNEIITIITVKDTPGFSFSTEHSKKFASLGLTVSLCNQHWHAYVAVLDGKIVRFESLSKKDERIAYNGTLYSNTIKAVSRAYTNGNASATIINGVEYSENKRGINIVVIDKVSGEVIDSVCFDTHDPNIPCYRFNKKQVTAANANAILPPPPISSANKPISAQTASAVPANRDLPISDTIGGNEQTLLHGMYWAAGFSGTYLDYFIDSGIKEIALYGNDMLVGLLYEQAIARGFKITGIYSDNEKKIAIRFPRVGSIDSKKITSINLNNFQVPIVVADIGCPSIFSKTLISDLKVIKLAELNYYSMIKRSLLDKVLDYSQKMNLKVCVLNMARIFEINNPSELEKTIISGNIDKTKLINSIYFDRGYSHEFVKCVNNPILIEEKNGIQFVAERRSEYHNCVNGYRVTANQPSEFFNTIYFFGNSVCYGVGTDDNHTIPSVLQNRINSQYDNSSPYSVLNCANTGGANTLAIIKSFEYHSPAEGDIIVLCMGFGSLIKKVYSKKTIWVETKDILSRPHSLGDIYYDIDHMNPIGYEACGNYLFDNMLSANTLESRQQCEDRAKKLISAKQSELKANSNLSDNDNVELQKYLDSISVYRDTTAKKIGSIVMNCNPFTLGHRYLIESSAAKCDKLYIFVVEEDRSMFPFKDRLELVRKGVADLSNVVVIPSGKFIISQTTFQAYFTKEETKNVIIDASNDINLFAYRIAPTLGITIRFAGEEPLDNVTNQYNATMQRLLPRAGIKFEVIKRKEEGGAPISASRVRALLKAKNFDEIAKITPPTTYDYLYKRFSKSKNILVLGGTRFMGIRLVEKLLEQNNFVTIATRGIHPDPFGKQVTRVKIDRLQEETMHTAFEGKHYDVVYDTTAYCSNAVKYALTHIKCDRYIQVSSVAIYGTKEILKREEQFDPSKEKFELCDSMENYGIGKRYAECAAYQLFPNISKAIVRVPFVVEPDNLDNKELNLRLYFYAKHIVKDIPMNLDNLDLVCSFVRTTDEAEFLIKIADSDYNGVVNLSSEGTATIKEIVEYLENVSGHKAIINSKGDLHPFNAQHFKIGVAFDLEKAKSIGYQPPHLKDWLWPLLSQYVADLNN